MECVPYDNSSSLVFDKKYDSDVEHAPHNDQTSGHYIRLKKSSMSHMLELWGNIENVSGIVFEEHKSKVSGSIWSYMISITMSKWADMYNLSVCK